MKLRSLVVIKLIPQILQAKNALNSANPSFLVGILVLVNAETANKIISMAYASKNVEEA